MEINYNLVGDDFYKQESWKQYHQELSYKRLTALKTSLVDLSEHAEKVSNKIQSYRSYLTLDRYFDDAAKFLRYKVMEESDSRMLAGLREQIEVLNKILKQYD